MSNESTTQAPVALSDDQTTLVSGGALPPTRDPRRLPRLHLGAATGVPVAGHQSGAAGADARARRSASDRPSRPNVKRSESVMRSSYGTAENSKHGVGVVWWPELEPLCRPGEGLVHVTEFEPEAFWMTRAGPSGGFISRLPEAVGHLAGPKLFHCVGAPFGGTVAQPAPHLEALSADIARSRRPGSAIT